MASLVNARFALYRLFPRLRPAVLAPTEPQERNIIAASPLFEALWYLEQNPDVAAAGMDPALHYFLHGAAEGRDPGPRFSTSGYLAGNPDVERYGMNPLLHYVLHGEAEGRQIGPSVPLQKIPAIARREHEEKAIARFEMFLRSSERIRFDAPAPARMSTIIVLHNKAHFTYACLKSIKDAAASRHDVELVIVDSGSSDKTRELLSRVDGAIKIILDDNAGFLRSVNAASRRCNGEYLVLINNDALLKKDALDCALQTMEQDPAIAVVGGRVVLPGGVLQEAGCIVWSDGSTAGYGRGRPPEAGEYMFRRDVAFCSGAFLMIRRDLFIKAGCFDERFAPAYYEETDLCVRFRQAGYRIVYDPRIEILHYEFGSAESPESALQIQARKRQTFVEKHRDFLRGCPEPDSQNWLKARSVDGDTRRVEGDRRRVLFLDDHIPYPELGVGYPRARNLLRAIAEEGHFLTMVPLEYPNESWESVRRVVPLVVEVLLGVSRATLPSLLTERVGYYDLIVASRPNNMRTLLAALERLPGGWTRPPIVYDAEAIWALRERLQRAVQGAAMQDTEYERALDVEVRMAGAASHVIAVNESEAAVFRDRGCSAVTVVSHGFRLTPTPRPFCDRRDLLFVGSLDDDPSPNADALIWFVREIMPLIREQLKTPPRLIVAGRCAAPRVRALASADTILLGQIPELTEAYNDARVFVAPHRYSGGNPTKVLEASAHGLPCVVGDLLAKQLGWNHDREVLSASIPRDFARRVIHAYSDEALWTRLRGAALQSVEQRFSEETFRTSLRFALRVC
jgi:GT2 family glycosyltransferase/glycosyltransferase involved in cell wall biosynthesis